MNIKTLKVLSFDEYKLTIAKGTVIYNVDDDRMGNYITSFLGYSIVIPYDDAAIILKADI